MAEERDKLEKLIEMQKKKVGTPETKPAAPPPTVPAAPPPAEPSAPSGFAGMQPSIMEEPSAPPPTVPAAPPVTPPPAQPVPVPPEIPTPAEIPPVPEPTEEVATLPEPQLPVAQLAYNRTNIEEIESLIESVVEEKWRQAMESLGDISMWKEKARTEIVSIKQELLRLEQRFENMEKALIGRVHEYDKHILNIGAEIKAIEKVMQKIMQPLSRNVKELERLTKKIKK